MNYLIVKRDNCPRDWCKLRSVYYTLIRAHSTFREANREREREREREIAIAK